MWIQFIAKKMVLTEQLREWAESRLWLATQAHEAQVRWVIGGLRHNAEHKIYRCRLEAALRDGQTLTVRQSADDPYDAVSAAADRLRRSLRRCAAARRTNIEELMSPACA